MPNVAVLYQIKHKNWMVNFELSAVLTVILQLHVEHLVTDWIRCEAPQYGRHIRNNISLCWQEKTCKSCFYVFPITEQRGNKPFVLRSFELENWELCGAWLQLESFLLETVLLHQRRMIRTCLTALCQVYSLVERRGFVVGLCQELGLAS